MSRSIVFGLGLESGLELKVQSEFESEVEPKVEPEVEPEIETGIKLGKLARTGTQRSGIVKNAPKLGVPDTHP